MKNCPKCKRTYSDETLAFCLIDGSVLSAPYDSGISEKEAETLVRAAAAVSPKRQNRWLPTIIVAGLLLVVGGGALFILYEQITFQSLFAAKEPYNPYKGSVSSLLPQKVGEFTLKNKIIPGEQIDTDRKEYGFIDHTGAIYKSDGGAEIELRIINFNSSKEAVDIVLKLSEKSKIQAGDKYKNEKAVGKRIVKDGENLWSNGSLIIFITSDEDDINTTEFEMGLPF